jgi:hypothetical protein
MRKRVVAGLAISLLGAGAIAAAVGISGAADAESPVGSSSAVAAQGKLIADIDTGGASLTGGRALNVPHGAERDVVTDSGSGLLRGAFHIDNTEAERDMDGSAAYQIVAQGQETGYWLVARMHWDLEEPDGEAECTIYEGDPGHGGKVSTNLLTCTGESDGQEDGGYTERFLFTLHHAG